MRRNAGEEHAGTQGCLRQEARPTSSGSEAGKYIPGSDARRSIRGSEAGAYAPGGNKARFSLSADEHYVEGQWSTVLREEQLQVPRCKLNKKMVVRYRFTVLRAELQDLSSSFDDDLRSSLEGGGPRSGRGCLFQRRASRVRDEERGREG